MAIAGHMSRRMLEYYSHVRMAAKRVALEKLHGGLMGSARAGWGDGTEAQKMPE
jgi:hypothetical protein